MPNMALPYQKRELRSLPSLGGGYGKALAHWSDWIFGYFLFLPVGAMLHFTSAG